MDLSLTTLLELLDAVSGLREVVRQRDLEEKLSTALDENRRYVKRVYT